MKKIIQTLIFFSFLIGFAQINEPFDYEKFSEPDTKNELSVYLKKTVPKKLLRQIKFSEKETNIVLSFSINKEKKVYSVKTNSFGKHKFNKAVIEAFENYPLEKLNLDSFNSKNRYYLQIVSNKRKKAIFNASTKVIVETPPVYEKCADLDFYEDIKTCLNREIIKHFYANANFDVLKKSFDANTTLKDKKDIELHLNQEVDLFIKFSISEDGKLLYHNQTAVPTFFKDEVKRVLSTVPTQIKAATLNGLEYKPLHSFTIKYKIDEKPEYKGDTRQYLELTKPSVNNDLSVFFSEKLSTEDIEKANLNRINNKFTLSFELDKNDVPFNIDTSARSAYLDQKIKEIFALYPISKLNFADKRKFNRYVIQILSFTDDTTLVNTDSVIGYERISVFIGCENSKNIAENKQCFSRSVQRHFAKKFDANLPNRLGLAPGRLRILISFKIDEKGNASKITTKLSQQSSALEYEVKRVMQLIPTMQSLPMQNGKVVEIKYSIPFTLIVQ